ncbi:hypothetical protein F2Q69_00027168 [Brassica cretica]|uniref:Uncharacterized protein n=1 Tax=Brassica cretica TaxID=69181 RepID=A0A8S9RZY2_BRACR|nr:hypothetical protein F2Q69_00027168 [Brassica cretica]
MVWCVPMDPSTTAAGCGFEHAVGLVLRLSGWLAVMSNSVGIGWELALVLHFVFAGIWTTKERRRPRADHSSSRVADGLPAWPDHEQGRRRTSGLLDHVWKELTSRERELGFGLGKRLGFQSKSATCTVAERDGAPVIGSTSGLQRLIRLGESFNLIYCARRLGPHGLGERSL